MHFKAKKGERNLNKSNILVKFRMHVQNRKDNLHARGLLRPSLTYGLACHYLLSKPKTQKVILWYWVSSTRSKATGKLIVHVPPQPLLLPSFHSMPFSGVFMGSLRSIFIHYIYLALALKFSLSMDLSVSSCFNNICNKKYKTSVAYSNSIYLTCMSVISWSSPGSAHMALLHASLILVLLPPD